MSDAALKRTGAAQKTRRVFLVIIDSLGCGAAPDAADFGDAGANTLAAIRRSPKFDCPNLERLGLFHIDGFEPTAPDAPIGIYGRFSEQSRAKDSVAGHWEIAGCVTPRPFPTFPDGFPKELIDEFIRVSGHGVLCNKSYSGTEVIRNYGEEHMRTGDLIVYTSADSVFQIAAHKDVVPLDELYRICRDARKILTGDYAMGRVIARPFTGDSPENFTRTSERHDFALEPTTTTILDILSANGFRSIGIGKTKDIFAGKGLDEEDTFPTAVNDFAMAKTLGLLDRDFEGLCFTNLVETDMIYGHRRDVDGYAEAVSRIDAWIGDVLPKMQEGDVLMITADHGCDPGFRGTDHTREYIPLVMYGPGLPSDVNLGTKDGFACIGRTILDLFGLDEKAQEAGLAGESFKERLDVRR